jgi:hypothetical protein
MRVGVQGVGLRASSPLEPVIVIPETGPDSYGDGSSLVSWLDADTGITLDPTNLSSMVDQAALAAGRVWNAVGSNFTPAADQNGKNRFNVTASPQHLLADDAGPTVSSGFVMAWYGRPFTSAGIARVPYAIDATDIEDGLGSISWDALADDIWVGDGLTANADQIASGSIALNSHYVFVVTYTSATGAMRGYWNGTDTTIGTPFTMSTGLSFTYQVATSGGKLSQGQYNWGQSFLYDTIPTLGLVNQIGQYISDHYGLGQTWALS